ncbi:MAG: hypothetical protein OEN20_02125 [Gammaproteobacteria bacterium]|nr:hypothetical protein [Gammaproteobacteria bacterium]
MRFDSYYSYCYTVDRLARPGSLFEIDALNPRRFAQAACGEYRLREKLHAVG